MKDRTNINIQGVKINSVDRYSRISVSSTMQIGNHVKNHRVEGFGEHNGDRGFFQNPQWGIEDSDFFDTQSEKKG
ncbi:hypothetical protein F7731_18095 [Cytobacillus depressus]|uniref:Uncharacterized protein n=1 Tax=Cytobacillus depressus TaxID=1602942 RepID=A0A6L3V1B8_9BACI|nr:hypothetical protein [Cytobacillus depressus]KAB2331505.1 hypothetical protein F7731_18095 [Cytobacillus depressus]